MPFGKLGAFFLTFWDPNFAPREHLGKPFWHLGSTLGGHFRTSDHPGGPWEQQDGHEVANNRIVVDFGVIPTLVSVSFGD